MMRVDFEHEIGAPVRLIEVDRPGTVTGCLRSTDGLQYQVVWWDNGSRKAEWLNSFEIEAKPCKLPSPPDTGGFVKKGI